MKKLIKILIFIVVIFPAVMFGQSADSIKIDYNYIDSYPQNASVNLNDEFIGKTPLFFVWKDSLFPKTLKINLGGFSEQTEIITTNGLLNRKYTLSPNGKHMVINGVKEDKLPYFKEPRKIVPIVISSIVTAGSGFAAFYFKSLASDNRKDYDVFGDPASLDKEKKYNLLGSISLAALQLGFGALMYFLFID
ncbi:MAG: hypothetical protein ABI543_01305 [Ignavibacteria bacterium]